MTTPGLSSSAERKISITRTFDDFSVTTSVWGKLIVLAPQVQWWTSIVPSTSVFSGTWTKSPLETDASCKAANFAEPSRVSCFMKCAFTKSLCEISASASGRQTMPAATWHSE